MKRLSAILAIILCGLILLGPLSIAKKAILPNGSRPQSNRIHLNTANTTRIQGISKEDIGVEVSKALYPYGGDKIRPQVIIILQSDKWQDILTLIPMIRLYNSSIITVDKVISPKVLEHIQSSNIQGAAELDGAQLLVLGRDTKELESQLDIVNLNSKYINYKDTEDLQRWIYSIPKTMKEQKYAFLVKDDDPLISIPAATWIANQGGILLYVNKENKLYEISRDILKKNKFKQVYLLADRKLDGNSILDPLKVKFKRVSAFGPEDFAVRFAKLSSKGDSIGWDADRIKDDSGHNYILCSKNEPSLAAIASQLGRRGRGGPILWTEGKRLSSVTENYLWRMKPNYWVSSSEGPYNSTWIIGNDSIINYGVQARVDYIQEVDSYESMGKQGVSGLDALAIIWLMISICGSLWVALHSFLRMRYLSTLTKLMWILAVLLLGPIGLWIYIISYINSPWTKINNKIMWMRPLWKQALVATAFGIAFGSGIIVSFMFLSTLIGLPTVLISGGLGIYLLGNPIIMTMVIAYIAALILNAYVFIPSNFIEMKDLSYKHARSESTLVAFVSITFIFIGMAIMVWWLFSRYVPMIPGEDYMLWWGVIQLSVAVGGIISYIPNLLLIKFGKANGTV